MIDQADDKNLEEQEKQLVSPTEAGEESVSGSSPSPSSDDDVGEMYKQVFGHEPKPGETIADEVEEAEKARRGIEPHEEEEQE